MKHKIKSIVFKIFGMRYKVRYNVPEDEIPGADAHISYQAEMIRIADKLSPERERNALLHEIIHSVFDHYDLRGLLANKKNEEKMVEKIADGLFQIFEANPNNSRKYLIGPYDDFILEEES